MLKDISYMSQIVLVLKTRICHYLVFDTLNIIISERKQSGKSKCHYLVLTN